MPARPFFLSKIAFLLIVVGWWSGANAVLIQVNSDDGEPLTGAVVWAVPKKSQANPAETVYTMDQVNRQFVPHVLVVPRGAEVRFPNSDPILHHVYSFSSAKTFQLKLYRGNNREPVTFDEPGVVDVGCNIHDWMLGYIVVVDSPYFTRTDERGAANLDVPPGRYQLKVWHRRMQTTYQPYSRAWEHRGEPVLSVWVTKELAPELVPSYADEFDGY